MDFLTGGGAVIGKVETVGGEMRESMSVTRAVGKGSGLGHFEGSEDDEKDCANVSQVLKE